jgi:DNA-binding NarL/FixJ family response regulator
MTLRAISIVLADDHPVVRSGICNFLSGEPDLKVVAEASGGKEALKLVRLHRPDVLVLDMEMPDLPGLEVARILKQEENPTRVLALSAYDDPAYVSGLLDNGAAGYITKEKPPALIIEAVRAVARGETRWFVQPGSRNSTGSELTERELTVLGMLASGTSNALIAERLFISENTVRNHLARIYEKLHVTTSREAIAWAWREGLGDSGSKTAP